MKYKIIHEDPQVMLTLPDWSDFDPEVSLAALEQLISKGRALAKQVGSLESPTFEHVVLPFEELFDEIGKCWGPVTHMHNVALTKYPTLEEVHSKGVEMYTTFATELSLDSSLCQVHQSILDQEGGRLSFEQKKIIEDALLDFHLNGVDLTPEKKERLHELNRKISTLGNQYGSNVQRSQDEWAYHVDDKEMLRGLSNEMIVQMEHEAKERGYASGYLITIKQPVYIAIVQRAEQRELRRIVYEAYVTRASEQGNGSYDNTEIMKELIALRHEKALLLGFENYNALSLAKKMAKKVGVVDRFYDELIAKARPQAQKEYAELGQYAKTALSLPELAPWDVSYAATKYEEHLYHIDHEELRKYFPKEKVMQGLFSLVERLFGMTLRERKDVPIWREGVTYYDLFDAEGKLRGGVYADLYAENGKRPGAWMDVCIERRKMSDKVQIPVAYFNCNFTRPRDGEVSTLRHDEIETVFHEFGHVLHHIVGLMDRPDLSMGGVEWDAVEFPSQILENWCWEEDVLRDMSAHISHGGVISDKEIESIKHTRMFQPGMFLVRQLALGAYDWELHRDHGADQAYDISAFWNAVWNKVAVTPMPEWGRYAHSFLHVFDGSYAAGYYSYLWAEVLAADAYEVFKQGGIFSREIGLQYLHQILEVGSLRPMEESYRAFCGHDPDPLALMRKYGLE